jgi:hypothetical protein
MVPENKQNRRYKQINLLAFFIGVLGLQPLSVIVEGSMDLRNLSDAMPGRKIKDNWTFRQSLGGRNSETMCPNFV